VTEGTDALDAPVRAVMSRPVERIDAGASVAEAAGRLATDDIGSLIVGEVVGIVTESDVVESVSDGRRASRTPVRAVMSAPVVTVTADATLRTAIDRMNDRNLKKLPVTDGGEVVGIVTTTDVIAALAPDLQELRDLLARE
jgi:CBS domain-containing protein